MNPLSLQNIAFAAVAATSLGWASLVPNRAAAQVISIRSVPVATGDQFLLHPSENLALGGTRIALDDHLLDPFVNPAKGSRVNGMTVFGSPVVYHVSGDNGSGRTLPVAVTVGSETWFGGGSFALQELTLASRDPVVWTWWGPGGDPTLGERSATNLYLQGYLGRRVGDGSFSLAAGASWAGLGAVDGVEHLYALSQRIDQSGSSVDFRAGLLGETEEGRAFEALLLHSRFDVTHDVTYLDFIWAQDRPSGGWISRTEANRDETHTTGLHLAYSAPLNEDGWRFGTAATVNRKSHPRIPNYEIQNIPRDPGDSWAYDFGVGLARRETDGVTFGLDLVFEPIWSDTWAEAVADTTGAGGDVIRAGEKTVEDEFFFSNAVIRTGLGHDFGRVGFGVGLELRSFRYELEQVDHIASSQRTQREDWMEWTPSLGLSLSLPGADLRYSGRATTGTGRPGVAWTPAQAAVMDQARSDFLIAPEAPLTLQDAWVLTSQFSVSIPIN